MERVGRTQVGATAQDGQGASGVAELRGVTALHCLGQLAQTSLGDGTPSLLHMGCVAGVGDGGEDTDDGQHHQQFDQGETTNPPPRRGWSVPNHLTQIGTREGGEEVHGSVQTFSRE